MGIADLPFLPFLGPLKGLAWVAGCIAQEAEQVYYDEDALRGTLLELELLLQDGQISEEDYNRAEEQIMERLEEARRRKESNDQAE